MGDPFSIATGCVALIGTIVKVSTSVTGFIKAFRVARSDLDAVSRELSSLQTILELIADDASKNAFPDTLQRQIEGIVSNCSQVLEEIGFTLEKYDNLGNRRAAEWALSGSADVTKLRLSLEAHKTALELALDMVQISISREMKTDISVIRDDTSIIKQDTTQILAQILHLRAQLPRGAQDIGQNVVLERYLADLTTYAESVRSEEPDQVAPTNTVDHDEPEDRRSRRRLSIASIKRSFSRNHNTELKLEVTDSIQRPADVQHGSTRVATSSTANSGTLQSRTRSVTIRGRSLSLTRSPYAATEKSGHPPLAGNVTAVTKPEGDAPVRKTSQRSLIAGIFGRQPGPQSKSAPSSPGFTPHKSVTATTNRRASISSPTATAQNGLEAGLPAGMRSSSQSRFDGAKGGLNDAKTTAFPASVTSGQPSRRTQIDTISGSWYLGKTIAKGFSSKVVKGSKIGGNEMVAIKIIRRSSAFPQGHESPLGKDPDKRAARAAATLFLFDHPYICSMKDFVRTDGRWYLVLEFIDGDNLLNRVIADGCFSEKRARAYSRQIASALDYCHKNHIVHRDIKLENILLTRSGDIKLMDFVLSNSFSPKSNLDTFCGSLYFSAPELLQRQPYIGPEIDVYSFGVVIYTMVVGEVPFDDENMAKLQGKIKTAAVKYPTFLSQYCCQLISRMLEKRPAQRASLAEIIIHPWMVKGFPGPPENYLPRRVPLTLPLDMNVIGRMGGFGFGSSTEIHDTIKNALLSNNGSVTPIVPKRIPSLYKRRNSSHTSLHKVTQEEDAATPNLSPKKDIPEAMISIYHLVREKMQREWLDLQEPTNSNEERVVKPALNLTSTGAFEYATRGSIQAQSFRMEPSEQKEDAEPELSANSIGNRVPRSTAVPLGSGSTKTSTAALLLRRFSTRRRPSPSAQSSTASG